MAFEKKIIGIVHCPRCNAKAELRIDQKKVDSKWVLVYVVCNTCRLNRYQYTTTRKAININLRVAKLKAASLKSAKHSRVLRKKIDELERGLPDSERNF